MPTFNMGVKCDCGHTKDNHYYANGYVAGGESDNCLKCSCQNFCSDTPIITYSHKEKIDIEAESHTVLGHTLHRKTNSWGGIRWEQKFDTPSGWYSVELTLDCEYAITIRFQDWQSFLGVGKTLQESERNIWKKISFERDKLNDFFQLANGGIM